jgi:signal transduction histidine kinase
MQMGVDPGGLTVEMALVGEALLALAEEENFELSGANVRLISRIIGHGTAASINAYAAMRDKQLAEQATQHFSFIAHELRNPLHSARLAANAIRSGSPRGLERLDRALTKLSELIDNSLLQARMFGAPKLHAETHDVHEILAAALDEVVAHADDRNQAIDIEAESFTIEADRKLLVSALGNLLKNAIKFTHDGGHIKLRARPVDARALFEVEDECGGVSDDLIGQLFQPFVQANADKSGFGLGLSIVKQVVNAHQGAVRVVNHPNKGCTFVLDLPLKRAEQKG